MELNSLGGNTYYISNATNIGVYKISEQSVYLIDSGNDSDAGKKILKLIENAGWKVKGILNTHSHADHIGGNKVIQDRKGCEVYSLGLEKHFIECPELESNFLYGAYPYQKIFNKFLCAKPSVVKDFNEIPGLSIFPLKGHCYDMIGIHTSDDVYFLGDALISEETIQKYHIFYLYDIKEQFKTLDYLETLKAQLFVFSHVQPLTDIKELIAKNREKMNEIIHLLLDICKEPITIEEILKQVFDHYGLTLNDNQYLIVGSTIKSYLSYLKDENKIDTFFQENRMFWKTYGGEK